MDVKKKVGELKKYHEKVKFFEDSLGKKNKAPKLSDYSKWFSKYQSGSLELPGIKIVSIFQLKNIKHVTDRSRD